jgi:hypothetical protein
MPDEDDDGTFRELSEIVMFLELNKDYCEILVEGRTDAAVIEEYLTSAGVDAAVFPVDDRVRVDAEEVKSAGENVGARGRVVACANFFSRTEASQQVTCIIDADFHYLEPDSIGELDCLLRTDYGSLELYSLAEGPLRRLLKMGLRASDELSVDDVIEAISRPLTQIFACRWALCAEEFSPSLLPVTKKDRLKVRGSHILLDTDKLIKDSIQSDSDGRARKLDLKAIQEKVKAVVESLKPDLRRFMNGHDLAITLSYYLKETWPSLVKDDRIGMQKSDTVAIALLLSLSFEELQAEPMFQRLLDRVQGVAA